MDANKFGSFIQSRRKELDLTQSELGEKLGVTDKAVSRWERGVGFPDISLLEPLAQALEITVVELMRSEKMEQEEIPIQEVETMMVQTIDLAAELERTKRRGRLLRFVALPALFLAWLFLDGVILYYVREPFWLRVVSLLLVNLGLTFGSRTVGYIARCEYLNPPKPLGELIAVGVSCVGVLIFCFSILLNTDGLRHLYAPAWLLGLGLIFVYPLYMAWHVLTGRQEEE